MSDKWMMFMLGCLFGNAVSAVCYVILAIYREEK